MSDNPFRGLVKGKRGGPIGKGIIRLGFAVLGVAAVGAAGYSSIFSVEGGHKAILFSRYSGVQEYVYGEGWHFMVPWLHRPIIYNVRTRATTIPTLTGSKDLQMVNVTVRVLSKPYVPKLAQIYCTLGKDYDSRVLPSIVNEVAKGVIAMFNASELITQRESISELIEKRLKQRAEEFLISLDDVSIPNLSFGQEYTQAVEAKQVAQQEAERAKFQVELAQQTKRSAVIQAEGDAEAAEMLNNAMQENPYFLELRRIDAAKDIANILAQSNNKIYVNSENLMLNLYSAISGQGDVATDKKR